jgi:hypothetical protein
MNLQIINIVLTIERSDNQFWGRVEHDDNLIVESADSVKELIIKMKSLLQDFNDLQPETVNFEINYDLTAFFELHNYLKISKIAELAGINPSLVRQYASGIKNPSIEQTKRIEVAVHSLAKQLQSTVLV